MSLTNHIALGCNASASATTCGAIASAVLIRIWHLEMLTLWKKKSNMSRKSERIPFSLHGSRRGPVFFLYLDFTWPLTAVTMAMMFWETVHLHAVLFCCHFFPLNRPVKYCQGKYVTWHSCPADNVEKKEQYGSLRMVKILDYNIQE